MRDLFPNAWHVARREYLTRVRSRTFSITTAIVAIVALAIVLLPTILRGMGVDRPPSVAVVTTVTDLRADPQTVLSATLAAGGGATVTSVEDEAAARQQVRDGKLTGLLEVSRDPDGELRFTFVSDEGPTSRTRLLVQQAAGAIATADRLATAGLSPEEQARAFQPPQFETVAADPTHEDRSAEEDFGSALLLGYAVVVLTFMAVMTYGNWVAASVAEEKSSRVMELLITAATPRQLLAGKVLGTGAAGLTQYAVIILAVAAGFLGSGPLERAIGLAPTGDTSFQLPALTVVDAVSFGLFFFGGFLLYCTLYAAAGSMVSRVEDVQQAGGPLIVIAMVGYFAAFAGLNTPDAAWVRIASLVPFFSPYLIPARMLLGDPTLLEIVGALVLLAVTVGVSLLLAARIYSAGVLLYGQRLKLRAVLRAARVAR